MSNKKIIVTGGPTREWIDPVRYISNASSGKMGIALADAAFKRTKDTIFIHGPIDKNLLTGKEFRTTEIESTEELLNTVMAELSPACIVIMAAAPADFRPEKKFASKLKKEEGSDELILRLKKNPDILQNITNRKSEEAALRNIFVAGFAAETDDTEKNALKKLKTKKLDMICLNDVSRKDSGIASDNNRVIIFVNDRVTPGGIKKIELPLLSKKETAEKIIERIEIQVEALDAGN